MNNLENLERFKILAAGFVIDDLDATEEQEFHDILAKNPEFATEIDDLQEVLSLVLDEFTNVEVPSHLQSKIIEQAELEFKSLSPEITETQVKSLSFPWRTWAMAILTIAIVALGLDNYRLRGNFGTLTAKNQQLQEEVKEIQAINSLLQESETKMVSFQGKQEMAMGNVSGSILVNNKQEKAMMIFKNLPAPPEGKHYVLWAFVANNKISCGEVKPKSWGNSFSEVAFTSQMTKDFFNSQFSGLAITLENNAETPMPTGPTMIQSSEI